MFVFFGFLSWSCIADLVSAARLCIILASASILILLSSTPLYRSNERRLPPFPCFPVSSDIYYLAVSRFFSLCQQSFLVLLTLLSLALNYFSWFLLSHCIVLAPLNFVFRDVHVLPHHPSSFRLYRNPVQSSLFFSCFEERPLFAFVLVILDMYYVPASFSLFRQLGRSRCSRLFHIIVIAFFNLCNHLSLWSSLNWPVRFPAWFLILHQIFAFQVILI